MKKLAALVALCIVVTWPPSAAVSAQTPAAWIAANCSAPGGILLVRPGGRYVSGYFGTLLADSLVRSGNDSDLAFHWMSWYVKHAHGSASGVDGVPDDVDWVGGAEVSRGRPDATDAYGAVFITLARDAFDRGDPAVRAFVLSHRDDLRRIVDSSLATLQSSGVTWSRPQHKIAYAIDNFQVYRGLLDAADLFRRAFNDTQAAAYYADKAAIVKHGIDTVLWDPETRTYRPYVNATNTGAPANLTVAYPDALAQVFAAYYGIVDPRSAQAATLVEAAAGALLASDYPLDEHRLVLLATMKRMGRDVAIPPFEPAQLCVDAGWYLDLDGR